MTRITTAMVGALVLAGLFPATALAGSFTDTAKVTSVTQRSERVVRPVEECRTDYERVERTVGDEPRSVAGSVVGGVVGGLLGNQIGGGSGKTVATAAGAIAGAIVGDRVAAGSAPAEVVVTEQPVRRCTTVERVEYLNKGYDVSYEFHGRAFTTHTTTRPGASIPVEVTVRPAH